MEFIFYYRGNISSDTSKECIFVPLVDLLATNLRNNTTSGSTAPPASNFESDFRDNITDGSSTPKTFMPSSHVTKNHHSTSTTSEISSGITTRKKERRDNAKNDYKCMLHFSVRTYLCCWVLAMQEELL
ncbi:uncharacterized protein E6C27_scaffold98G00730 [Cucumis melo var. makuwa]|uniref:Uncharacterized protein n=1 Tax=Cucumis melo var. makuwa TaxID=1194695 RepID=A0A5A7UXJ4_CUCMM|nr:uncharacterized protein E6C27_scaffold98G00730 [Cucumis melo var. makuwa]